MRFADWTLALAVLVGLLLLAGGQRVRRTRPGSLRFSDVGSVKRLASPGVRRRQVVLLGLRSAALLLAVAAVARPQAEKRFDEIITEGIDIMLALDVSSSMMTPDFKPKHRLDVAKEVVHNFVQGLKNDRVGLVVYAAESFTQCPLTLDYGVLLNFLEQVDILMNVNGRPRMGDGTAIGSAIANAVNRLRDSKAKSKVVILLTDGINNRGIDPPTVARAAQALGIRVYCIGAGKERAGMQQLDDPLFGRFFLPQAGPELDEKALQEIARITEGQYYRATDPEALAKVYSEIWKLEKTRFPVKEYEKYKELFPYFLIPAALLFLGEIVASNTVYRKVP
jgi:Ca-activated chloride channel family protein